MHSDLLFLSAGEYSIHYNLQTTTLRCGNKDIMYNYFFFFTFIPLIVNIVDYNLKVFKTIKVISYLII